MAELTPEKLLERLARGKAIPVIVLVGADAYLLDRCRNGILEACVPEGARDWAVARYEFSASAIAEILGRARTLPMLAPRQILILEGAEAIERLGEESREEILKSLGAYLESPSPFTVLVLEAASLDRRQKLFRLLSEKAQLVVLSIGDESAANVAVQMAKQLGAELDRDAAVLLADILNGEPARMRMELEKLSAYVATRGRITSADVEVLVVAARKNTVWQLADMLASRRRDAAFEFLDNLLREGEQPAGIVGALAWMYRKLIEANELPAHTAGYQAARILRMAPDSAERALRQAQRIPRQNLLEGLIALAEADSQLKSANPDPRATMEFLLARLTSTPA